ncbi:hypothetical protein AB0N06_09820 [Streptomyces sp. NPDC051020]|uniref:hypothetical protein n=1 Tax=Streptomyces sp. NPDC051020 TaxID=3155409 RepID=UPI003423CAE9
MLSDDCAPSRAESLAQSLSYAHGYAEELRLMLAEGKPDADKAARLVQAIRNMMLATLDDLYELDDVQQEIDAVGAIRGLSDAQLFSAITDTPPPKIRR